MIHKLKTHSPFFEDLLKGVKNFELRKDDRDFQIEDILLLEEWDPVFKVETGRRVRREVQYVLRGNDISPKWGLQSGFCILGLRKVS